MICNIGLFLACLGSIHTGQKMGTRVNVKPAELALFSYLFLTGVFILLHFSVLSHALGLLVLRVAVTLLVLLLIWWQSRKPEGDAIGLVRFMFPVAMLAYLYSETDQLNNLVYASDLDPLFSQLEERLFGFQPALAFAEQFPWNILAETMYLGYFSYYLMLAAVPLFIRLTAGPQAGDRAMFIVIHSFFIFYIVFILFPVSGPQFYFPDWPAFPPGYVFGPLMRFIQEWGEAPTAAFPSSHVSICLMLVLLSFRYARPLLKWLLPVSILLVFSTVYIRAHYVIDILGAVAVTWPLYRLSGLVFDRLSPKLQTYRA